MEHMFSTLRGMGLSCYLSYIKLRYWRWLGGNSVTFLQINSLILSLLLHKDATDNKSDCIEL